MIVQWLGHSAFRVEIEGVVALFDPFLTGNPKFSGDRDAAIAGVTHVLLTHGHNDHFGDTIDVLAKTGATLVSTPELCGYVSSVAPAAKCVGMNIGGTARLGDASVSMVRAHHSSSYHAPDGATIYGGEPTGLILKVGGRSVYHMGDTAAYSDMGLVNELHRPEVGIVPIGDHYTMGAEEAALAVNRWFDFRAVFPCHYRTFPVLAQDASAFVSRVIKGKVHAPEPMERVET
ncbi:MAG: metal-dependent hydrolase [Hyphomicrobiales bacterium]|nr:metal-dependent hydrolase [Hyphomicrobiales bacterium]